MKRTYVTVAATAATALLAGSAILLWLGDEDTPCRSGTTVAGGALGGPFELVSETGDTVTDAQIIDRPSLIYFGYTYCPDVCPLDASRNAEALDLLAERGHDNVQALFITVDPERDTPEVLTEYTDYMHPDMIGLTGTPEQIRAAAKAYRVYYQRQGDDPATYLVDHTFYTYLVTPEEGFVDILRGAPGAGGSEGQSAEDVAAITACYLERF
ncbi:SCO family protein [Palleronia caenipelagi]|uniref:SCO family protein n=1 Tax=Palleronia caenipelagi TaxID=2489174 RepID=A0A547Q6M8_9RHOB|nr:SCO family protein [Palleronia caenipelagi]TRD22024.1 SCO family protein [Palleronia caenipelagi]